MIEEIIYRTTSNRRDRDEGFVIERQQHYKIDWIDSDNLTFCVLEYRPELGNSRFDHARFFSFEEVSEKDLDKLKEGTIFLYVAGYRIEGGHKTKGTELWFDWGGKD